MALTIDALLRARKKAQARATRTPTPTPRATPTPSFGPPGPAGRPLPPSPSGEKPSPTLRVPKPGTPEYYRYQRTPISRGGGGGVRYGAPPTKKVAGFAGGSDWFAMPSGRWIYAPEAKGKKGLALVRALGQAAGRQAAQGKKRNKAGPDWLRGEDPFAGVKAVGGLLKKIFR